MSHCGAITHGGVISHSGAGGVPANTLLEGGPRDRTRCAGVCTSTETKARPTLFFVRGAARSERGCDVARRPGWLGLGVRGGWRVALSTHHRPITAPITHHRMPVRVWERDHARREGRARVEGMVKGGVRDKVGSLNLSGVTQAIEGRKPHRDAGYPSA